MSTFMMLFGLLFSHLGDLGKAWDAAGKLKQLVIDIESKAIPGDQKMAAVLNDFEALLNALDPTLEKGFETIAASVEHFVNAIVADFNAFKHAAPVVTP